MHGKAKLVGIFDEYRQDMIKTINNYAKAQNMLQGNFDDSVQVTPPPILVTE